MLKRIARLASLCLVVVAVTVSVSAPRASAQPLADRVPDEAYVYMGWRGADAMPGAFANSRFKRFLDASNIPAVMHDTLPKAVALAAKKGGPEAFRTVHLIETLLVPLWKYPTAAYIGIDMSGGQPVPKGAILCQAGAQAGVIKQTLDELMAGADMPPFPVRTFVEGDIVGIAVGYDDATSAMAGGPGNASKSLGASVAFTNAMSKVGVAEPMFVVHADGEVLLRLIDDVVARSNEPQLVERWPRIREASGLAGFKRVLMAAGFDGQDWSERVFVEAPSPRRGLFAMGDAAPLDDATLKLVPSTATSFAAGPFDAAKVVTQLRELVGQIDEDAGTKFDQGLGVVQMYVGRNLVRDILEPLGEQWVMYDDPTTAGFGFAGAVVVNKLDDPIKANQGLGALAIAINNTLAGQLSKEGVEIAIRQTKVGDLTINYFAVPLIAPAWAIKDGNLYVGLFPQVVASAVRHASASDRKSILENADFQAMRKRLGVDRPTSITYADQRASVLHSYQLTLLMTRGLVGAADVFGIRSPELVLPPLDDLKQHLSFSGSVGWADEQGFHAKDVQPFPGSKLVSGQVSPLLLAAPLAMAGGAIGSAIDRQNANSRNAVDAARASAAAAHPVREACADRLRQIASACRAYAAGHDGAFPPDLGTIAMFMHENPGHRGDLFLCPSLKRGSQTTDLSVDALGDWIRANATYVYVGNGLNVNAPRDSLVAYEKSDAHLGNGMNLLFADGRVEWHEMPAATKIIRANAR